MPSTLSQQDPDSETPDVTFFRRKNSPILFNPIDLWQTVRVVSGAAPHTHSARLWEQSCGSTRWLATPSGAANQSVLNGDGSFVQSERDTKFCLALWKETSVSWTIPSPCWPCRDCHTRMWDTSKSVEARPLSTCWIGEGAAPPGPTKFPFDKWQVKENPFDQIHQSYFLRLECVFSSEKQNVFNRAVRPGFIFWFCKRVEVMWNIWTPRQSSNSNVQYVSTILKDPSWTLRNISLSDKKHLYQEQCRAAWQKDECAQTAGVHRLVSARMQRSIDFESLTYFVTICWIICSIAFPKSLQFCALEWLNSVLSVHSTKALRSVHSTSESAVRLSRRVIVLSGLSIVRMLEVATLQLCRILGWGPTTFLSSHRISPRIKSPESHFYNY